MFKSTDDILNSKIMNKNIFKIYIYNPGKVNHMEELHMKSPEFESMDDGISYLKTIDTTYYTLHEIDGEDTFLFYIPSVGKEKYIIRSNRTLSMIL